ncbi:MAG: error-prone DNA polymerase [Thermoleophilia bacterium]|nr:error-prone DNA polymerase [Thermoleophilia bacterium]
MQPYVELHCHSAYSFLDGASLPEELAARAAELGYGALALTDHDGLHGSLEHAHAAKALGVRPITGAEVTLAGGAHVTLLCESQRGYANLCRLLTAAHGRRGAPATPPPTGSPTRLEPALDLALLEERSDGLVCLSGCARSGLAVRDPNAAARLARALGRERFYVELQRPYLRGDTRRNAALRDLASSLGVRTVATGDVHAHHPRRARLQDVLVAIRCGTPLDGCEPERRGNDQFVLVSPGEAAARFPDDPDAVRATVELAERLEFDLTRELGYRYPDFSGQDDPADVQLARICRDELARRYRGSPHESGPGARLEEELALIAELRLSGFFLLHHDVLELARRVALEVRGAGSPRHTLPPGRGRGSSVGSIVCYLTGLSHVDPIAAGLSLGRFLNRELVSVPDIDLDFPRDIRERLIPAVIERYGREHAALVASFATYRARGAIREVGKALGLPAAELERLARLSEGWDAREVGRELALAPGAREKLRSPRWRALPELCAEIAGLPRHISQHPGGMVISSRPLVELVPVVPAAMAGRQLCQWDKDSCADAGFLKIDLLGLGMLSAVEECVEAIARRRGEPIDLSRIPLDDPAVYREIQAADTVGVFQIESRAQMQMLVRTLPESLDDLTVEVALVRPGPIQGGAVHPYVERRQRLRADPGYVPPYDHPLLEEPLRETLGVVVFQEQVLGVAVALAGFTVGEAEGLRRAMSRKRSRDAIEAYRQRFVGGATARGVDRGTAERVFEKLLGFASFGFPKSHAAAFALLAYQSAWLRHHYPAELLCALLNAQPMGFYPPASLVRDAQRRGRRVRGPDVNASEAACTLEGDSVRIGLGFIRGLGEEPARALVAEREAGGAFCAVADLARRAPLDRPALEALVLSGACDAFGGSRRELLWQLGLAPRPASTGSGGAARQLVLPLGPTSEVPELPEESAWERVLADYRATALSVGPHPLALLRPHLPAGAVSSSELAQCGHGERVAVAGLVVARQRPATARGVVFMLLEDEHGQVNLVVPPPVYDRHRATIRGEPLLLARGRFEANGRNRNVVCDELLSLAPLARRVANVAELRPSLPEAHSFGR